MLIFDSSYSCGAVFSVHLYIQVGADQGLVIADIVSLGLSANIQKTTTTSVEEPATAPCPPGPWICGLEITPSVLHVEGHKMTEDIFGRSKTGRHVVKIPRVDNAKNAIIHANPCTCHNRAGRANAGAPPLCPTDCA